MKRFIYLLTTTFLLLLNESFMFANELESEVNYLLELSKNNISQASSLMSLLSLLTTIFTVTFISIIIFIVVKLIELAKEIKASKGISQAIQEQSQEITRLSKENLEIRNEIRDQSLMAKGIDDNEYVELLTKTLKWRVNMGNMNTIKNLVWGLFKPEEYRAGLRKLRTILSGSDIPEFMDVIKKKYYETLDGTMAKGKLLTWVYGIKEQGRKLQDLLYQEAKEIIDRDKSRKEFFRELPMGFYFDRQLDAAKKFLKEK